jgi:hypothetical protein
MRERWKTASERERWAWGRKAVCMLQVCGQVDKKMDIA